MSQSQREECSAVVYVDGLPGHSRRAECKNGFPVTAPCHGLGTGVVAPVCCDERLCGRLYPVTGAPRVLSKGQP